MMFSNWFSLEKDKILDSKDNLRLYTMSQPMYQLQKPYFSKIREENINNEFNLHDGYFSKLVINQNVFGYIFRCTHKNVVLIGKDNKSFTIPFLITCIYQPVLFKTKNNIVKLLGKDQALKTGIRIIKQYVKDTDDFDLTLFKENMTDINNIFPEYNKMKADDNFDPEFWNMTESDYHDIIDYIKAFDEKTYKYYSSVDKTNILKIWLKN